LGERLSGVLKEKNRGDLCNSCDRSKCHPHVRS
jgi:hypothetical protein